MKTLIVIPTYNEELNIKAIIEKINLILSRYDFSILVVDDNSKDDTANIVKNLQKQYENLYLLQRGGKYGLASAYIDGFKYGADLGYKAFIQMDADFSHNPDYLPLMLEKIQENDVVIGSRNVKGGKVIGWNLLRYLVSKGGSLYSRIILKCPIMDLTGGFNAWRLDILNKIGLNNIISKGYSFQIEMKYRAYVLGAQIAEFPIVFEDRKFGKSKMNKRIFFEALLNVIKIRFIV
ncbi:MAG: polyprenol monophosphomannose synthase [Cyanobacteria bacterium SIG27]|nr:polyprenol monophosphomannose synthase [Cyanobacteria bacterium SIG27]MBQ9150156.1 polyprenol monophosphomannose synthase [bacterium]